MGNLILKYEEEITLTFSRNKGNLLLHHASAWCGVIARNQALAVNNLIFIVLFD
jgi:hypothetical protein